jgi:hypothetical protein
LNTPSEEELFLQKVKERYGDTKPTKAQVVADFGINRERAGWAIKNVYNVAEVTPETTKSAVAEAKNKERHLTDYQISNAKKQADMVPGVRFDGEQPGYGKIPATISLTDTETGSTFYLPEGSTAKDIGKRVKELRLSFKTPVTPEPEKGVVEDVQPEVQKTKTEVSQTELPLPETSIKGLPNDTKNITGIPSEKPLGEEPVGPGPVGETGKGAVEGSGILQTQEEVTKPISDIEEEAKGAVTGEPTPSEKIASMQPEQNPLTMGGLAAGQELPDKAINIRLDKMNASYDAKRAVLETAADFSGKIDEARRGVIKNEAVKELADNLGMSETKLLKRKRGQAFNAEEALAARNLLNASANRIVGVKNDLMAKRKAGKLTDEDLINF